MAAARNRGSYGARAISRRQVVLIGALAATAVAGPGFGTDALAATVSKDRAKRGAPLALIYRGPASSRGCPEAAASLLQKMPTPFRTVFCGPRERVRVTRDTLRSAALYVQPGGGDDLEAAWRAVRDSAEPIREFVQRGGRYLGICMGGYLAGIEPGFGLLPGDSGEYSKSKGATVHSNIDTTVSVDWGGQRRKIFFQDGPYFTAGKDRATVLAAYSNGLSAAIVAPSGRGRIGVCGPHPEAPASWFREAGLPIVNDDDLGFDLINRTMA